MTPNIIQETSQGLSHIPLQDALFREREIYCIGEITREYVHALVMQLRWLQHDSPSAEITLFVGSLGRRYIGCFWPFFLPSPALLFSLHWSARFPGTLLVRSGKPAVECSLHGGIQPGSVSL